MPDVHIPVVDVPSRPGAVSRLLVVVAIDGGYRYGNEDGDEEEDEHEEDGHHPVICSKGEKNIDMYLSGDIKSQIWHGGEEHSCTCTMSDGYVPLTRPPFSHQIATIKIPLFQ